MVNLTSPVGVVNQASPVGVVNLAPLVGVVNLASLVGVVGQAPPVGVVNLVPSPVGVVNLTPGEFGTTSWCGPPPLQVDMAPLGGVEPKRQSAPGVRLILGCDLYMGGYGTPPAGG